MLTKTQIDKAIAACTSETMLNDGATGRGGGSLQLRIRKTKNGASSVWLAAWKRNGKRHTQQIGRYPALSLADARARFRDEIRPLLVAGESDPVAALEYQAIAPTVENLFLQYVGHLKARNAGAAGHIEHVLLKGKHAAADAGLDRFTRDLIQQHARGDTGSRHYDHADYLPMLREAMKQWGKWFENNVLKKQQQKRAA